MQRLVRWVIFSAVALGIGSWHATAQSVSSAEVVGVVSDATGAAIPGATVVSTAATGSRDLQRYDIGCWIHVSCTEQYRAHGW